MLKDIVLLIACAGCAAGQVAPGTPSFEVASIKPAAPQEMDRISVSTRRDQGRIIFTNVSLMNVLTRAYSVKNFQINGPSWLDSERFDITAKLPDGASEDQIPFMLQNLLAERFKMAVRRETREQPVYALLVGKDGPKLNKSEPSSANPGFLPALPPPPPDGGARGEAQDGPGGGQRVANVVMGQGGGTGGPPKGMMMISSDGRVEARRSTMKSFADTLSNLLDRPVVDLTGIEGEYDVALEISPDDMAGMRRLALAPSRATQAAQPAPEATPGASIFTAIQQLGLRLDSRKAPVEFIVVEKVERAPTEN
jgi:uncharacterized protein (TIGR03435 family)